MGDITEHMIRSAMWLAKWLNGERAGGWESVKTALDKFAKASVVDFTVYLIDCHLAEVAFLALEDGKKDGLAKAQLAESEKYVQIAIKNLKKYGHLFDRRTRAESLSRQSGVASQ